jgi:hypothetical protein
MAGGNRSTGRKTCSSLTMSIRNSRLAALGLNPGLSDEKPATDRPSYATTSLHLGLSSLRGEALN